MTPRVSVIIINYNCWQDTIECLKSLKKVTYKNIEVIVVDNASTDDSQEKLEEYIKNLNTYFLILNSTNKGYAGGCNIGIKQALAKDADYVLLLNPDTIVKPNFLDELVKIAEEWKKQGKLAFFGPKIYFANPQTRKPANPKIYSNGGIINWSQTKGTLKDYGKLASKHAPKKPFETNYVSGTCILASKEVIEKVGFLREEYFLYYEDTDWAIRAKKKGIAQVIVPKSIIWHKASTTTKEGSSSYVYYHTRNGLHCGWENGNESQRTVIICLSLLTFIKQPLKLFIPSKKRWVIPVARGVIDFWRGKMGRM